MDTRSIPAMLRVIKPLLAAALFIGTQFTAASAQLPAFNGAEGFGGTFTGTPPAAGWFSNATVYHVTNLNNSGAGSLRGAFVENSANKIIVFDVGGTIQLSGSLDIKNLANYYIAGQTAPSPVTIYGDTTQLTHSSGKLNSNVILRYLTFRKGTGNGQDAVTFAGGGLGSNLILDHVSGSWSEDEVLSVANNNTNVTVQYSIISDALVNNHAYGSLIRPRIDSNVTFHHNLYAHNASRQARFGTYNAQTLTADFRNNVIYNWRDRASYAGGSSEDEQEFADINYVGNYLIAGPGTIGSASRAFSVDKNIDVRVYQSGNFIDPDRMLNPGGVPNGSDTGWGMFAVSTPIVDQTLTQMATPFAMSPVTTQSALDAYNQVLDHVGNYWWSRDAIDARVVNNVRTNTGPPIGAAAPIASELTGVLSAPMITRPAGWDSDADGMPDVWEVAHGLNPNSSLDFKLDFDNDGYVNLQEYLDEIGAFPAPAPVVYVGGSNRYAQITNWRTNDGGITSGSHWQPTRFDEAQINSGMLTVDAAGQHAGRLKIGANAGDNATLNITGGWLDVEEEIAIGADPAATATLNLVGGVLSTPELSKGAGGTFSFSGGSLHADRVGFDLANQGGTLAPGRSIGQTHVAGDLALHSGTLEIELASTVLSDTLLVDGNVNLGGNLAVATLGAFTPTHGDSWQIIAAGSIGGAFNSVTPGYSLQQQGGNLWLFFGTGPPPVLAGDYNDDGIVDAADYVVWRANMGTNNSLLNETVSLGVVDQQDYVVWRARFGTVAAPGSGQLAGVSVPEPTGMMLVILAILALVFAPNSAHAISWNRAQRQPAEWLDTPEGRQVVDNVLHYQLPSGGWPKNIDMAKTLSASDKRRLAKRRDEATIDNGATYTQLRFLARAYSATRDERIREAFFKGLDYLLEAQYDNGGWPIYYPLRGGYDNHIHFNDNSVSGVLMLMEDVAGGHAPFDFVDSGRKKRAAAALAKGIDCILKCQVIVDGRRTAWCAQHDEITLAPAPARTFEPVSLSGHESVGLVRCLMQVENPSPEIIAAVRDAVAWLDSVKMDGIRVVRIDTPEGRDLAVKEDPHAPPIWARFYEIGTNRPIFTGRNAIVRYRYDEIERERRTGYAYYGDWPQKLISKEYPAWIGKLTGTAK